MKDNYTNLDEGTFGSYPMAKILLDILHNSTGMQRRYVMRHLTAYKQGLAIVRKSSSRDYHSRFVMIDALLEYYLLRMKDPRLSEKIKDYASGYVRTEYKKVKRFLSADKKAWKLIQKANETRPH